MVKIKTKKTMNLPQLLEWTWENNMRNLSFRGYDEKGYVVSISINDKGEFSSDWRISKNVIFEAEVEEEVNGETILGRLYEVYFDGLKHDTNMFTNTTTNSLITSKTALIYTVIDNQVIVLWEKYTGGFR